MQATDEGTVSNSRRGSLALATARLCRMMSAVALHSTSLFPAIALLAGRKRTHAVSARLDAGPALDRVRPSLARHIGVLGCCGRSGLRLRCAGRRLDDEGSPPAAYSAVGPPGFGETTK